MAPIVDPEELGRRIRKLRLEHRLTLKQVEESSGLSATHLSEIERGRTSPTIGALVRIARALHKDASFFIETEEREDVSHQLREQPRRFSPASGVEAESLTRGVPGSGIYAYRLQFGGDAHGELSLPPQDLPGDSVYLVRGGAVSASIGGNTLQLGPGDSLQATLVVGHHLRSRSGPAEVILVSTRALEPEA